MTEKRDFSKDREICNAATEGPWGCRHPSDRSRVPQPSPSVIWAGAHYPPAHCYGSNLADGDFIAAAREGWPAALDEIERLKVERESVRRMISRVVRLLDTHPVVHTSSHFDELYEAYWLLSDYLEFGELPNA